ncbi:hypothetical protein LSH36_346g03001 [Paralvinella palmiformis]|uniref:Serine incorporator n=1 Tax=Paralvinella palmiformis TaxID=53620 RepID=A0AAD9JFE1_9ANNE|nr:hypothetical protein LSH36_346g03001 [Paralvinella palmiformis]
MGCILGSIPYLCSDVGIGTDLGEITVTKAKFDCSVVVGYQAVYRVCFGLSAFFFLFSMLMIKVGSSRDPRSKIQNGFWFFKILLIIGVTIAAFFIPSANGEFNTGLLFFTILFYLIAIVLVVVFFIFYTNHVTNPRSGLLQSSVITIYVMYLTWTAMTNNKDRKCNPSIKFVNETLVLDNTDMSQNVDNQFDTLSIVSLVLFLICVLYASIRTAAHTNLGKLTMKEPVHLEERGSGEFLISSNPNSGSSTGDAERDGQRVYDDEEEGVTYSYSFFHFMPSSDLQTFGINEPSMWIKISSSWVCILLYLWTLIAPIVLKDREFD